MEDENYRNFVVTKLNRTLDKKIGPDNHIDDVVCTGDFYKTYIINILLNFGF